MIHECQGSAVWLWGAPRDHTELATMAPSFYPSRRRLKLPIPVWDIQYQRKRQKKFSDPSLHPIGFLRYHGVPPASVTYVLNNARDSNCNIDIEPHSAFLFCFCFFSFFLKKPIVQYTPIASNTIRSVTYCRNLFYTCQSQALSGRKGSFPCWYRKTLPVFHGEGLRLACVEYG